MLSRRFLLKQSLKPALNFIKIENVAQIHFGCSHSTKIALLSKHFKNYRRNVFSTGPQIRFESSNVSTHQSTVESTTGLDPIPEPPVPLSEITEAAIKDFTLEPTFASQGLGGWTPVGIVQNCLEYLHVDCGLPWWGAVVCGTLVIRLLMFPIVVIAQRNSAKMNNNLPQMQHLQMKITEARQRGDKIDAARFTNEMMMFMKQKDVNPFKNMLPPLCQAPVFISVFMGLRGMSSIPVESLKTGGLWWFTDLTVPDQFYILPLITSATLFLTIKVGAETGQPTQNMIIMKYVMMGLPLIVFPFTLNFHGLMLVYWTTSNFISLCQVGFLRVPKVREYFKIEKIVRHQKTTLPIKDKGFVNNIKDAWNNMKITNELEQRERADKMAFMRAGREPIKKTYKYDPTQVRAKSSSAAQAKKSV
ncbi:mitochondrial inner membrane protein OXA1L isoform X1 [Homalodisca vitripennis]|uniref:mitochondrial inner membrane protein OXA1L isoform X1 n=1 Tax=Homalodisca vitripennis TaxID=197043 RepID=UPI001EEC3690|nr:mitochondrial inner membrane protein OXA1L isoform X1 [Homalodisca vitripennis]